MGCYDLEGLSQAVVLEEQASEDDYCEVDTIFRVLEEDSEELPNNFPF